MNEIQSVKMSGWTEMVRLQKESGLSVKNWCLENNIPENTYYYRLKRLREEALKTIHGDAPSGNFVKLSSASVLSSSDVAARIRRGELVVEVSNNASGAMLSFLKDVITHAV